jgi:hypothetical protein
MKRLLKLPKIHSVILPGKSLAILIYALLISCSSGLNPEEEEYKKFLNIGQVNASYYTEPQTKKKYALVKGSISNLGNRRLEVVELTMQFKDSTGNVIFEDHGFPVFVSAFSNPDNVQYMDPGQKIPFAFKSLGCPPTWQPGQVTIEVTKIVFSVEK